MKTTVVAYPITEHFNLQKSTLGDSLWIYQEMQKYPVLLKVATLTTEELLSLYHSFGDPLRSDVKSLLPNETYYLGFILKPSYILCQGNNSGHDTELSAASWCEAWGLCLLQLNDSYGNSICVQSGFRLLKMPHMFSKVKKKVLIPYWNFSASSWQSDFLINLEWPLQVSMGSSFPQLSLVLGVLSTETLVQLTRYVWLLQSHLVGLKTQDSSKLMTCLDLNVVYFERASYNWGFQRMQRP